MVWPPAATASSVDMDTCFLASKRAPFGVGMLWEEVWVSFSPSSIPSRELSARGNAPSTVCCRAPAAPPWAAPKHSWGPHQYSFFWTYLLDTKAKYGMFSWKIVSISFTLLFTTWWFAALLHKVPGIWPQKASKWQMRYWSNNLPVI